HISGHARHGQRRVRGPRAASGPDGGRPLARPRHASLTVRSLRAAVSFLTVLPVANADGGVGTRLGRAYFPAVGALVGLVAGCVLVLVEAISTPLLGAAAAVAALCLLTGAIHVDGLADSADGLLGRGDAERR